MAIKHLKVKKSFIRTSMPCSSPSWHTYSFQSRACTTCSVSSASLEVRSLPNPWTQLVHDTEKPICRLKSKNKKSKSKNSKIFELHNRFYFLFFFVPQLPQLILQQLLSFNNFFLIFVFIRLIFSFFLPTYYSTSPTLARSLFCSSTASCSCSL